MGGLGSGEGLRSRGPSHIDDDDVGCGVARPRGCVSSMYGVKVMRWSVRDEDDDYDDDGTGRRKTEECERSDERKDSQRQGKERKVSSHAQAQAYTTQERAGQCEPKQKDMTAGTAGKVLSRRTVD